MGRPWNSGLLPFALMGSESKDRPPLFPSDEPQFPDLYLVRVPGPPRLAMRAGLGETPKPETRPGRQAGVGGSEGAWQIEGRVWEWAESGLNQSGASCVCLA